MKFLIDVTFNGRVFELQNKSSIEEFLEENQPALLEEACCAKIDGVVKDLRDYIEKSCVLEILTFDDEEGRKTFWHTTAHILAQALSQLFNKVSFGVGPAIENGFFYDIKTSPKVSIQDFEKIEEQMKKIVSQNLRLERKFVSYEEAKALFKEKGQDHKLELIEEFKEKNEPISIYQQGEFFDLCAGPHLLYTKNVKALKLLNITGAYWKADAKNEMLDRIYGVSFPEKEQLKEHLKLLKEAKEVDHRKLGKELELFNFVEEGPGFVFFLPNGVIVKNELIDYWRKEHMKAGYKEIITPTILSKKLWETSGHWEHYKQNMYTTTIDDQDFAIKPMNCPGCILVYKMHAHSYKELPLRFCEFGTVHRHELSGALHGLMRARCFTQDDAHIFLTKDQIKGEVKRIIELIDRIYGRFSFSYFLELATMPEDHIGEVSSWEEATLALKQAVEEVGLPIKINEGDGAFYGPKIDFYLKDCLNRMWQCGTIQLDFQLPQRFSLEFIGQDGKKHVPIMIHRVVYGSIERFIGILTEHFKGAFPFFIAPLQVIILPVSDRFLDYAKTIEEKILEHNFRVKIDKRDEKLGYKLRQAQLKKVPFVVVVGEKEEEEKMVSVRKYKEKDTIKKTLDQFIKELEMLKE